MEIRKSSAYGAGHRGSCAGAASAVQRMSMPYAVSGAAAMSSGGGYPLVLPRRQRTLPPALPDWSNLDSARSWTFRPVPVPRRADGPSRWSIDCETVTKVHRWMVDNDWGGGRDGH